jgi:hypothetical protein
VVLELLMVAGVLLLAMPALVRGARGLRRRSRYYGRAVGADRVALVLVVAIQLLTLLLVAVLSLVVLVCAVGAIVRDPGDARSGLGVLPARPAARGPGRAHLRPARPAASASTSDPCSPVSQ